MTLANGIALGYIAVGLTIAAIMYALFMGDVNVRCDDPACADHRQFQREAGELADSVHLALDSPSRGRAALALTLILICVAAMWPAVGVGVIVLAVKDKR